MSRNGSGTYSLPSNSWNPATNGTPATAADWQTLINDVAAALTQSLSKDGQTPLTGNLAVGGNKVTGLAAASANGDAVRFEQIALAALGAAASGANADITSLSGVTSINGGQLAGLRNRIINGDMRVAQRGTSFTPALNTVVYTLDRWFVVASGAAPTISASAASFGPYTSAPILSIAGIASNTATTMFQRIESANSADLAGQTTTFSAWVYQTTGSSQSIYCASSYANSADNFTAQTAIATTAMTPAVASGVWTKVSCQIAVPVAAVTGIAVSLQVGAGGALVAGQTLAFGKVQLELGSTATTFEQRPYGMELALCQRYYYRIQADDTTYIFGAGCATSATAGTFLGSFPVTMRTSPSALEQNGTAAHYTVQTGGVDRASSSVPTHWTLTSKEQWAVFTAVASGQTAGQAGVLYAQNATAYLGWSAEL